MFGSVGLLWSWVGGVNAFLLPLAVTIHSWIFIVAAATWVGKPLGWSMKGLKFDLKLVGLFVFTFSFLGLFLLGPTSALYPVCVLGVISTVWIDHIVAIRRENAINAEMAELERQESALEA